MLVSQAYVNWGRWVGACPESGCFDAKALTPGQEMLVCERGHLSPIVWPAQAAGIVAALGRRLDESKRNWFPRGHPMAVSGGYPQDQTPEDLERERVAYEQGGGADPDRRAQVLALLGELGVDVAADGTVSGRV